MKQHRSWMLFGAGLILAASSFFLWTACGSSSGNANVRLVNALPTQTDLDFLVDSKSVATSIAYGTASSYVGVSSGSRHLQGQVTGSTTIVADTTTTVNSSTYTSLVSFLDATNSNNLLVLTDNNAAPPSGDFNLRVINVCSGLGTQDVYVVASGTDLNSVSPTFSSLAVGGVSSYTSQAAGTWDVVFTSPSFKVPNQDSGALVFTSGQVRTLLLLNVPSGGFETTLLTDSH